MELDALIKVGWDAPLHESVSKAGGEIVKRTTIEENDRWDEWVVQPDGARCTHQGQTGRPAA
jgi:hypothetical protein